jgi:rhodanese-related sulfurtransferase
VSLWLQLAAGVALAFALWRMFRLLRPGIAPEVAARDAAAGTAVIIDVREPAEWSAGVAAPAVLLPLSDLRGARREWGPFLAAHRGRRLFLYCAAGGRSGMAAGLLRREGWATENLGSYARWQATGLPVRRP